MTKRFAFVTILAVGLPVAASAQERKSPLADAPAIRKRVELREHRFEIGPGIGSSVGQDFYHAVFVGARLGFHIADWLALSGTIGQNITPNFKTSFHDKLYDVLPDAKGTDRTPTRADAEAGMNKIGQVIGLQVEIVPFTGKFALFSKLFLNYDFYVFGGPGFINFTADTACPGTASPSCAVTGFKPGANFGVGTHMFFNDWFALNLEVRDIFLRNNPAGRDENGDGVANDDDIAWHSNFMVGLNLMFFLPGKAVISN
jgi:outer membrane beta-barrel protein